MQEQSQDPALEAFLDFLAQDMAANPGRLRELDSALMERANALVEGIEVDLDEDLGEESLL